MHFRILSEKNDYSFQPDLYHQRNKIETIFSVLKRKLVSLKAKYWIRVKEIEIKVFFSNPFKTDKFILYHGCF
jgi:hypothetical protein